MKRNILIASALAVLSGGIFTSCIGDGDDTIVLESGNKYDIPSDELAEQNPEIYGDYTTNIPNVNYTIEKEGNDAIVRLDMTGIKESDSYDWLRLVGTAQEGQNIWVSVDDKPKGISVYNNSDNDQNEQRLLSDLVFVVDNSGSMGEESNAIARDIISFANTLKDSHIDIRFACVGYDGDINGALDFTDAETLNGYLSRSTGTSRTVGFYGNRATELQNKASSYSTYGECGGAAIRYADANLTFRTGSNRVYINFTDEPNQPNGKEGYSVESFKDQEMWDTNKGTVHTVFSASPDEWNSTLYNEKPWLISEYTGGTTLFAPYDFEGVELTKLPVTGAMANSYVIRFTNIKEFMDGQAHRVKITIRSKDGKTYAEKIFYINFGLPEA